ncbi:helix-turn-helix transcriptional regulator [Streptomyces sp. WAC06614]|uniref:ArsR/SmtB family transcription factor n=1 Tax=Streptomyces sp. WAC06614 TaxID=2487416 RepID=UPI000F77084F|nr:metalloregulator ArsR/SmtB family transcription factor [Streptomyces sp. WAC06614]RSS83674.1 transcriptional regulator [Streptomyces sp. WAC06614]
MTVPLYQAKAEFFRMLGHPMRIRVLELLQDGPLPVRQLLAATQVEASALSQQLAVLRRSGIVTATREGTTVVYELAGGDVGQLLAAARRILSDGAGRTVAAAQGLGRGPGERLVSTGMPTDRVVRGRTAR